MTPNFKLMNGLTNERINNLRNFGRISNSPKNQKQWGKNNNKKNALLVAYSLILLHLITLIIIKIGLYSDNTKAQRTKLNTLPNVLIF